MKYLTLERKIYYQKELQKCINCKDEIWDLDNGLLPILTSINKNQNIQTTLSRKPEYIDKENYTSYLFLAYKKNIEKRLYKLIDKLESKFGDKVDIRWTDNSGTRDPEFYKEHPEFLKDLNNPNLSHLECVTKEEVYGDICQFWFVFITKDAEEINMEQHDEFWKYLENNLIKI